MNRSILLKAIICFLSIGLLSCNNDKSTDESKITGLLQKWNKANADKDIAVISSLYGDNINFYGNSKDKNTCVENKLFFFKKHPDYYQQIFGQIQTDKIGEGEFKCSFVKRVTVDQKTNDYPSFLIFTNVNGDWKITTESDLVTEKNLAKRKLIEVQKDAVSGDFNGDGSLDYAWLVPPKISDDGTDCNGDCVAFIKFSDPSIPEVKVENCISGKPDNLGDLNDDGNEEIGVLPGWFTSCWHSYFVYTLNSGKWINAVDPISTHCNQWDAGIKPIEKDLNKKGFVIIRYSEMTDADIVTKSKSVRIAR